MVSGFEGLNWMDNGRFKSGQIPWNKGKKLAGFIPWMKGKRHSSLALKKMVEVRKMKGSYVAWNKGKKGSQRAWNRGLKTGPLSITHRAKISAANSGEKSYLWQGGLTEQNILVRKRLEYRLWREAVFKRDNYTCQGCGDNRGGNLEADHIKPFALYPKLRFAIDNGRTLCASCHKKTDTWGWKTRQLIKKVNSHEQ